MPAVLPKRYQGPNEVLDYPFDWIGSAPPVFASGETISSATFTADSGLTIVAQQYTTTNATVWLSGGEIGETYTVECSIVTNQGRDFTQSMLLAIIQR